MSGIWEMFECLHFVADTAAEECFLGTSIWLKSFLIMRRWRSDRKHFFLFKIYASTWTRHNKLNTRGLAVWSLNFLVIASHKFHQHTKPKSSRNGSRNQSDYNIWLLLCHLSTHVRTLISLKAPEIDWIERAVITLQWKWIVPLVLIQLHQSLGTIMNGDIIQSFGLWYICKRA